MTRLNVVCVDSMEIRMGSPFRVCRLRFEGKWIPDLPETDWQDRFAWSARKRKLALVRWDTAGNVPGFRIWIVDTVAHTVETSPRFDGCCEELWWDGQEGVSWTAFPEIEGRYALKIPPAS